MEFGLSEEIMKNIKKIVNKNSKYKFYIFGSRARGDYHKTSDIDIAVYENLPDVDKFKIMNEFDELNIIYNIDLVFISKRTKKQLLSSIKKDEKEIE